MGRTITPKYRLEVTHGISCTPMVWRGRVTALRLAQYVASYNESLKPGGVNAHVPTGLGRSIDECRITGAVVIRQADASIRATYREVVPPAK